MIRIQKLRDGECDSCGSEDEIIWLAIGDTEVTVCAGCADDMATMISDELEETNT